MAYSTGLQADNRELFHNCLLHQYRFLIVSHTIVSLFLVCNIFITKNEILKVDDTCCCNDILGEAFPSAIMPCLVQSLATPVNSKVRLVDESNTNL